VALTREFEMAHAQTRAAGEKVALITGASGGIGFAAGLALIRAGYRVFGTSRQAAPDEVRQGIHMLRCDVTDDESVKKLIKDVVGLAGRIDVLVNNAGITRDAMVHRMTDEQWDSVIGVNLTGAFHLCRAAYPVMRASADGGPPHHRKVVNITSINGIYGTVANANYSASKAGLIGLTKTLAREWGRQRINVNAVAPGYIAGTRLTAPRADGDVSGIPPEIIERIERTIPIGRGGTPDDVAGCVSFLSGPDSDYLTGQVLELHGGLEFIQVV
jgi:3-oxoacyl-[acyl-carrier protein] reductase